MKVTVLFGTESGNAELAANDVAAALAPVGEINVADLDDVSPADLGPDALYLIICSTYGDGELPSSAQAFFDALTADAPDLTGVSYGMFGLGDTDYGETFGNGAKILDAALTERGAKRVGEYGQYDAADFSNVGDSAVPWAQGIIDSL